MEPLLALLGQDPAPPPLQRCAALVRLRRALPEAGAALPAGLLPRIEAAVVHAVALAPAEPAAPPSAPVWPAGSH